MLILIWLQLFFVCYLLYIGFREHSVEREAREILNKSFENTDLELEIEKFNKEISKELNLLYLFIQEEFSSYDENYQRIN